MSAKAAPAGGGLADSSIALVGAGKMGFAILRGLANARPRRLLVVEPKPALELIRFCGAAAIDLAATVAPDAPPFDALVLAVKPQTLADAAQALAPLIGPQTLVLSILAGKRICDLSARLAARAFVRAMPNTPAAVGRGVTGAFANAETSASQRALAQNLLQALGDVEWIESEALMDALTAVSGSGPAYVFLLVEALAEAGARAGLPADLATRLARATVSGAGELLRQSPEPAGLLRENVTSPGGTTAAALSVLMAADGLTSLMTRAVAKATERSRELSG